LLVVFLRRHSEEGCDVVEAFTSRWFSAVNGSAFARKWWEGVCLCVCWWFVMSIACACVCVKYCLS
jgi:hypothetical protein